MAFSLPTFNLSCNIWRATNPIGNPPDNVSVCNLAWGKRVSTSLLGGPRVSVVLMTLLLPPGTDIRDASTQALQDLVEVPAGSGRIYIVLGVDDIGKGFANEHRAAVIGKDTTYGYWPSPIP